MKESNIFFATNTFNYGNEYSGPTRNFFKEKQGNVDFFKQVMDYDALVKFRSSPQMGGTFNSKYYVANINQIHQLDPNFSSVMISSRKVDPVIEAENKVYDKEYGYPSENNFYPLLEEIVITDEEIGYADELLGKWVENDKPLDSDEDNSFSIYIKQKVEQDNSSGTVKPEDAGIEDIDDKDPYYYIYEEEAGKEKKSFGDVDKARIYEEKYGSIFRAFSEVAQEEIIQAPLEQYSFVNAGPGTGKTYTLMQKIIYMVNELEADPQEILILCFTNAAVNEIKARIRKYAEEEGNREFINVDVRTFHSFSWLLISQANELFADREEYHYIDISKLNYDQSIMHATRIIRKYGDEVFGACCHLIVDEIQDLTNERASLVISMVQECIKNNVGVTVLGDSCQAIYDYSDDETSFVMKSDRFYKYIFSEFYEHGKFYKLEKNHRQSELLIKLTSPLRKKILEEKKEAVRIAISNLKSQLPELVSGSLSSKISEYELMNLQNEGTLCLMCRNNAQVLATSTNLRKRGIEHTVNAYNEFEYLADWIGIVFGLYTKEIISFDDFKKIMIDSNRDNDVVDIWQRLQELIGSQNNVLKKNDILRAIAMSKVDDPIFRNVPKSKLIVSNIHKSKGREYDSVIVEKKFINRLINNVKEANSVQDYLQEAKTLYVAITRPKNKLFINSLATTDVSLKRINTGRKRWVRGDGENLKTIEVRALSDSNIDSFDYPDIQTYIIHNVSVGDEINLQMDNSEMSITYRIIHTTDKGARVIGTVTNDFVNDIDAIISPYKSPWPRRITGLYVSGIHSQISENLDRVWCWVDFCGLGVAHTDVY